MLGNTQKQEYKDLYAMIEAMRPGGNVRVLPEALDEMERLVEIMHQDVRDTLEWRDRFERTIREVGSALADVTRAARVTLAHAEEATARLEQK